MSGTPLAFHATNLLSEISPNSNEKLRSFKSKETCSLCVLLTSNNRFVFASQFPVCSAAMDNKVVPAYTSPSEVMDALQTDTGMYEVRESIRVEFVLNEPAKVAEVTATLDGLSATITADGYMMVSKMSFHKGICAKREHVTAIVQFSRRYLCKRCSCTATYHLDLYC